MVAVAVIHKGAQGGEGVTVGWDGQGRLPGGGGPGAILRTREKSGREEMAKAEQHLGKGGTHLGGREEPD